MNKIDAAGGYAYPSGESDNHGGMTLRDLFAAHALAGLIAAHAGKSVVPAPEKGAEMAYGYADAMLAERDKPKPKAAPAADELDPE